MNEQTRLRFDCFDENNVGNLTQNNEALQPKTSRISHPSGHLRDSFSALLRKHRGEIPKTTDSLVIPIQPLDPAVAVDQLAEVGLNHGEVTGSALDDTGGGPTR